MKQTYRLQLVYFSFLLSTLINVIAVGFALGLRKMSPLSWNTVPAGNNLVDSKDKSGFSPSCPQCTSRVAWCFPLALNTLFCPFIDNGTDLKMHVELISPAKDSTATFLVFRNISSTIAF